MSVTPQSLLYHLCVLLILFLMLQVIKQHSSKTFTLASLVERNAMPTVPFLLRILYLFSLLIYVFIIFKVLLFSKLGYILLFSCNSQISYDLSFILALSIPSCISENTYHTVYSVLITYMYFLMFAVFLGFKQQTHTDKLQNLISNKISMCCAMLVKGSIIILKKNNINPDLATLIKNIYIDRICNLVIMLNTENNIITVNASCCSIQYVLSH